MFGELMSLRRASASTPSESSPSFALYLLPSLRVPFRRRRATEPAPSPPTAASALSSPFSSSSSSTTTTPSLYSSPLSPTSPTIPDLPTSTTPQTTRRLSRTQPATLRCRTCSTDLAFHAQIVSKGFMGRHGRAYLVAPPSPHSQPSCPRSPLNSTNNNNNNTPEKEDEEKGSADLVNVRVGRAEDRLLVTGAHVVADISCVGCGSVVGWKYVDARDPGQRYKVGKFILETRRVVGYHCWEDVDVPVVDGDTPGGVGLWGAEEEGGGSDGGSVIVFDSEDEDECEDLFAAVWDPKVVAQRRKSKVVNMLRDGGELA